MASAGRWWRGTDWVMQLHVRWLLHLRLLQHAPRSWQARTLAGRELLQLHAGWPLQLGLGHMLVMPASRRSTTAQVR
jgi:hypothetical protein